MKIEKNISLKNYNTFGINATAKEFISISNEEDLQHILSEYRTKDVFILSGGSNMLLTKDISTLVIHIGLTGIKEEKQTDDTILITANAGENWHDFVLYCIKNDYGGLENLSLIPGYVGSAPIQNIGAYGVELKDRFVSCEATNIKTSEKVIFSNKDCKFGYRNSIFKNEVKGKYIITKVTFRLSTSNHQLNTSYGAIENALKQKQITNPSIKDVSEAVIRIRQSKLPDPKEIGNSGSFFKNPVISKSSFDKLQSVFPDIPHYQVGDNQVKVPAGWLIEQCGFKGKRWGDAGVHKNQALVLVNYDNASGKEILDLSKKIQKEVKKLFSIHLETEVNII